MTSTGIDLNDPKLEMTSFRTTNENIESVGKDTIEDYDEEFATKKRRRWQIDM